MRPITRTIVFALYAALLAFSGAAHAKRGLVVFNSGEELFEVASYQASPQSRSINIGYKCSHFGLFWADVYTWDCKMVEYVSDTQYANLPGQLTSQLQGLSQYKMSKAKRGFWNRYAFWLLIGLVLFWMYRQRTQVDADAARIDKIEAFKLRQQMRAQAEAAGSSSNSSADSRA